MASKNSGVVGAVVALGVVGVALVLAQTGGWQIKTWTCASECASVLLTCESSAELACCCPSGQPPTWSCSCQDADCGGQTACQGPRTQS